MDLAASSVIMRRVYGTMVLLPLVFAVWYDQKTAGFVLMFLALFMGIEAKRITKMPTITGYLVAGLILAQSMPLWLIDRPSAAVIVFALFGAATVFFEVKKLTVAIFIGLLSVCLGYASFLLSQPSGHVMLIALAAIISACDIAAYFVGKRVGGPKLWQQVSPNKTVSGSVGGLVAAIGVTMVLGDIFGIADKRDALIAGVSFGILAQAGDLLESAIKRCLSVKDSGSILLGHGGVLDRFDGYIFVVPAFYLYFFGM